MDRAALLEQLANLVLAVSKPHPVRVAIDGIAAVGKTVLADELAAPLRQRGHPVIRATIDGFHRPRAERYRRGPDSPQGYYHDAFDYAALRNALLLPLGPGGNRQYRLTTFDYISDVPVNDPLRTAPSDAVLLCDGVFLLRPELDDCWDLRIFLQVDDDVAIQRAAGRDRALFEDVQARYWKRYVPAHHIYLDAVRPRERADVVVDNNDLLNPNLVKPELKRLTTDYTDYTDSSIQSV